MLNLMPIINGKAVKRADLPVFEFEQFREKLLEISRYGYIVQFFGYEDDNKLFVLAVMRLENQLLAGCARLPESYPSLTIKRPKFNLFERELAEQFGVRPLGHPWLKMIRYQPNWRQRPDVFGNNYKEDIPGRYPYFKVEGEEIHEVAVGPVHAGIIEPGHFRFQCAGERVLHLEISHGYQHRGIERLLIKSAPLRRPFIVENIAGDTAMANSISYSQAIEALGGLTVSPEAMTVRTIALELERLANHVGDLGAMSGDVAFTPPAAFFGRIRGEFLNLLLLLSGNRFGKGLIRPGGTVLPTGKMELAAIKAKINELRPEIDHCIELLLTAHTVLSRFEQCGIVSREAAEGLGLVGPAGRASWQSYDARRDFPVERYADLPPCPWEHPTGDVLARARIRAAEISHSFDCLNILLASGGRTETIIRPETHKLAPSAMVVTINEAWRGELSHCLLTDAEGKIIRYKVKDPSFHNWSGLAMALRDEEISDFPINNKSFNLSYCGMDL
ncbi:MAG: hydrogenase [Deltaproteobacteria bacterium]|nr:hydrogenase [Deltaproteobacteria bacterium]